MKRKQHYDAQAVALNYLVDQLFQEAYDRKFTWDQLADKAGLANQTVVKLGNRVTRFPQFRTVECLAIALGGSLIFKQGKITAFKTKSHKIHRLYKRDLKLKIVA